MTAAGGGVGVLHDVMLLTLLKYKQASDYESVPAVGIASALQVEKEPLVERESQAAVECAALRRPGEVSLGSVSGRAVGLPQVLLLFLALCVAQVNLTQVWITSELRID